jgi:arylsulfatase A-like enzyme
MKRALLFALILSAFATPRPSFGAPPNVIVILVDDLGYSDLSCYGSEIPTPHIDALAKGGTRFRDFYNCAQCCPTRASLISGMYPHEAGVGDMIDQHTLAVRTAANSPRYSDRLDPKALTIAERLRPAGYQTYMTGKWHLGYNEGQRPLQRGFDRYYGILSGADSYWRPNSLHEGETRIPPDKLPKDFYATDAFTTKAIEFVKQGDPTKPFFLYLAYNAVHHPFDAPEYEIQKHKGKYDVGWDVIRERRFARQKELGLWPADLKLPPRDPQSQPWTGSEHQMKFAHRMEVYAAMLTKMDENIGRLTDSLKQSGQLDNTLILFLSDNGAWATSATYGQEWAETGDTPFRLFKTFTHEGGICTAFIAHWPARIPAGTLNTRRYAHVKDILPTLLDVAGVRGNQTGDAPIGSPSLPISGRSFLPALLDASHADNEPLFWERMGNSAVRDGRWKLVRSYSRTLARVGPRTGDWELYDLEADPNEKQDLAPLQSDKVRELVAHYEAWEKRVGVIPREEILIRIPSSDRK